MKSQKTKIISLLEKEMKKAEKKLEKTVLEIVAIQREKEKQTGLKEETFFCACVSRKFDLIRSQQALFMEGKENVSVV